MLWQLQLIRAENGIEYEHNRFQTRAVTCNGIEKAPVVIEIILRSLRFRRHAVVGVNGFAQGL
jgi:hypothetical protein